MSKLILIAIGGAAGALLRFWIMSGVHAQLGRTFLYGTLLVNLLGSFLIGLLYVVLAKKAIINTEGDYALIMIGLLGAFTTFSSFSIETINLIEAGQLAKAALNVFSHISLCFTGCWCGLMLGRALVT